MVVLTNFPPPTSGIKHEQQSTTVLINEREIGKGTLFIAESCLSWVNSCTGEGFSLQYPHIAIHAISRDVETHPEECIYIMVDTQIDDTKHLQQNDSEEDEFSDPGMTEMRFVPEDKEMLDTMFQALSECQALHPDPQDTFSDDDSDIYEDADEDGDGAYVMGGDTPGMYGYSNHDGVSNGTGVAHPPMEMDADQFEDADGSEDS